MKAGCFHDLPSFDGNRNEKTPAKPGFRVSVNRRKPVEQINAEPEA
jgi:hypothetical protein